MGRAIKEVSVFSKNQTIQAVRTLPYPPVILPEIYAMAKDHAACRPSEERTAELWARGVGGQPLRSVCSARGGLGGESDVGGRIGQQVERRDRPFADCWLLSRSPASGHSAPLQVFTYGCAHKPFDTGAVLGSKNVSTHRSNRIDDAVAQSIYKIHFVRPPRLRRTNLGNRRAWRAFLWRDQ